jgi:hypothetical protein
VRPSTANTCSASAVRSCYLPPVGQRHGIRSAQLVRVRGSSGALWICRDAQLDKVRKLLEGSSDNVRIAVMHHHLHPFPEPLEARGSDKVILDMSTVRDAGLVEQRLERLNFPMLLHGHKHKPQLRETLVRDVNAAFAQSTRPLIVSGCGSTGVSEGELEHNQSNHFAIIELLTQTREKGADFVRVEWREFPLAPGAEWTTQQMDPARIRLSEPLPTSLRCGPAPSWDYSRPAPVPTLRCERTMRSR